MRCKGNGRTDGRFGPCVAVSQHDDDGDGDDDNDNDGRDTTLAFLNATSVRASKRVPERESERASEGTDEIAGQDDQKRGMHGTTHKDAG